MNTADALSDHHNERSESMSVMTSAGGRNDFAVNSRASSSAPTVTVPPLFPSTSGAAPEQIEDDALLRPNVATEHHGPVVGGRLPRRVSFGVVAVQTDGVDTVPDRVQPWTLDRSEPPTEPEDTTTSAQFSTGALFVGIPWLDCTGLCYVAAAFLMITVGIIVSTVTSQHAPADEDGGGCRSVFDNFKASVDSTFICYLLCGSTLILMGFGITVLVAQQQEEEADQDEFEHKAEVRARNAAQLWIVGPIFVCSGMLVCVKAITHIYKRMHPQRNAGDFLTPDSRASLQPSLPPSYSRALQAPVPSTVLEEEDKPMDDGLDAEDSESLARVTLNFDPPPPSYDEAMDIIRRRSDASTVRAEMLRARAVDHSAQFPSPEQSRRYSR